MPQATSLSLRTTILLRDYTTCLSCLLNGKRHLMYYRMVQPLPIMFGKVSGELGDPPNIMGKDETIP
jgi:hypothetical protein